MNKLKLVLAVLLSFWVGKVTAGDIRNVPSDGASPINADYGGVDIATNSFYIGLATVPSETGSQGIGYKKFFASTTNVSGIYATSRWTVYGVNFSTGLCQNAAGADFISVQTSSSSATQAKEVTRFYNYVFISTMANGNVCGGVQFTRWPIRVYGNLFWGVNFPLNGTNPYNRADLLFYKEPD